LDASIGHEAFWSNEFAARFPNAIVGIITLLVIYRIGKKLINEQFGFLWVLAYAGSFLPHFYFRSGIIDPTFNLFIFLSIYFWAKTTEDREKSKVGAAPYIAGFFGGMATLTKGPVGVLIVGLAVLIYWIYKRQRNAISIVDILKYGAVTLVVSFAWFGVEFVKNGPYFLQEFIVYQIRLFMTQDAGHGGPFYYHALVLLLGCFPVSLFAIQGFFKQAETQKEQHYLTWIKISFWVVLVLFSIVNTKIVHYSSFCYFPITFIGAYIMHLQLKKGEAYGKKIIGFAFTLIGGVLAAAFVLIPVAMANISTLLPRIEQYVNSSFAWANLHAPVQWNGYEWLPGLALFIGLLFFLRFAKSNAWKAIIALYIGVIVTIELVLPLVVPKIEGYSQKEVIDFYRSIAKEDKYVYVHGYKSYAPYFYANTQPTLNPYANSLEWLLVCDIDKPAYFVSKLGTIENEALRKFTNVEQIGGEYGYVFYRRNAVTKTTKNELIKDWCSKRR
jgi:4-amino-4-deoxy-L-arabinose transferase-like glycosyltransferase